MDGNGKPCLGFLQPRSGENLRADYFPMAERKTRASKRDRRPTIVRSILAQNICALRDRKWPEEPTITGRNKILAQHLFTGLPQVQRIAKGEVGTSVDYVEWLAEIFEVRPQDLLSPYFATSFKDQPPSSHPDTRDDGAELQRREAPGRSRQ
jgi:hypothetical protein